MPHAVTLWRTMGESHAPPPMDDLRFLEGTYADLEEAHDHCCDVFNAIEALQGTELWRTLPLETRRALSAAHAHVGALEGVLSHIV